MMYHPPIWMFLKTVPGIEWDMAAFVFLSHHLKVREDSLAALLRTGKEWQIKLPTPDNGELQDFLRLIRNANWPVFPEVWSFDNKPLFESVENAKKRLADYLEKLDVDLGENVERKCLLRAVRARSSRQTRPALALCGKNIPSRNGLNIASTRLGFVTALTFEPRLSKDV